VRWISKHYCLRACLICFSSSLKIGAIHSYEMSANFYQNTRCYLSKASNFHNYRCEILNSSANSCYVKQSILQYTYMCSPYSSESSPFVSTGYIYIYIYIYIFCTRKWKTFAVFTYRTYPRKIFSYILTLRGELESMNRTLRRTLMKRLEILLSRTFPTLAARNSLLLEAVCEPWWLKGSKYMFYVRLDFSLSAFYS
jgi:hypothetical protein